MEMDDDVVRVLREMARDGRAPHEIAEWLWVGAAHARNIAWIAYMSKAFRVPLRVLKGLGAGHERSDLDRELAPWVYPSIDSF